MASPLKPLSFSPKTLIPQIHNQNPKFTSISISSSLRNPSSPLKHRLAAGETLYGLFLLSSSPTIAEIAGFAGYDYVVIDMEHGPGGISESLPCLRALSATKTAAILRLPETSPTWAKKALDIGPQGLMFPTIETAEAAAFAVSCCRFPPRGIRGSAHSVVRASGYGINDNYLDCCEKDLLIMCQIETVRAVDNVEAIAGVDGVDCLQMGPMDLGASMGFLGDEGNGEVTAKVREAERRVLEAKKTYLSGFAMPFDLPGDMKKRGYDMVAGAVDVGMFRKAAVEDVMRFWRGE